MKNKICLILAAMLMVQCAIAQDTTFLSEYFKLIKTYNTLDEVYQAHPELKPAPPKIVIKDDEVLFYNDERTIVNRMQVVKEEDIPRTDTLYEKYHENYKISRNYRTVDGVLLVIAKSYGNDRSHHPKQKLIEVYDNTGAFLTNISEDSDIKISHNKQFFASTFEGEALMGLVEIFDFKGRKLCTYQNETQLSIRYDRNNNLIINELYDFTILIKDSLCEDKAYYNYFQELGINAVSDAFYSNELNRLLISTFGYKIYFIDTKNGSLIWDKLSDQIEKCIMLKKESLIIAQTKKSISPDQPTEKHLLLLDSNNGEILFDILIDEIFLISSSNIIYKMGGVYYVYKI